MTDQPKRGKLYFPRWLTKQGGGATTEELQEIADRLFGEGAPEIVLVGPPFEIGDRVALQPHTDLWMRGARYGTVRGHRLGRKGGDT